MHIEQSDVFQGGLKLVLLEFNFTSERPHISSIPCPLADPGGLNPAVWKFNSGSQDWTLTQVRLYCRKPEALWFSHCAQGAWGPSLFQGTCPWFCSR